MKILFYSSLFMVLFKGGIAQRLGIPLFSVNIKTDTSKAFYFFSPIKIGAQGAVSSPADVILDNRGEVLYFKKYLKGKFSGGLKLQSNGLLSFFYEDKFYLMDSTFTIVDSVWCKNGLLQDSHDFQILPNGHFLLLGYEHVEMDLSGYKYFNKNQSPGSTKAKVKFDVIQELDAAKNVVFEWHSRKHYSFDDTDPASLYKPDDVDHIHFNSIEMDYDGNLLVCVKNFNEITKINRETDAIMWRLGGKRNQFTFINDSLMFKAQHDIRRLNNGNITLFDNGSEGKPVHPECAKEYILDEKKLTAELVWYHINHPRGYSSGWGNVQRLPNGNTLINYGRCDIELNTIFNVINPEGRKIFEVSSGDSVHNYRAYTYSSLPWKLKQPRITLLKLPTGVKLDAGEGHSMYLWSTGETTRTILVKKPGTYKVFVPFGPGGFIASELCIVSSGKILGKVSSDKKK